MGDRRRANCTCCGKHRDEVGPISWNGNCLPCAEALQRENAEQIAAGTGYAARRRVAGYERYAEKMRAKFSGQATSDA
jgi:hypothetical protein